MNVIRILQLAAFAWALPGIAQQAMASPALVVTPESGLLFDETALSVTGALPGTAVTLTATLVDNDGRVWSSQAVLFADVEGRVSTEKQASVSGTYTGVEPYGLQWSMLPIPAEQLGASGHDPSDWPSFPVLSAVEPVVVRYQAALASAIRDPSHTVLHAEQHIAFMAPGVRRTPIADQAFEGVLFEAEGPGPHPVVMVVTGSGGGVNERQAALLASHGITALAIAHFNYPGRPDELADIPLEYFYHATDWLREYTGAPRIGLVGGSRGGEGVLLLAAMQPEPYGAVVSNVPSNAVWPGCCSADASARPAWTFRGEPIHGYRYTFEADQGFDDQDENIDYPRFFLGGMLDPGAAAIPVEAIQAPVLLLSGDSDALWPLAVAGEQVLARLKQHQFVYPVQHVAYPGAGHAATSALFVSALAQRSVHPVSKTVIPLGGAPALNAAASRDAHGRTVAFFKEHLGSSAR